MAVFRCFIRGDNFPSILDGRSILFGFYTTRFVEASTPEEAEFLVLEQLRRDPSLRLPEGVAHNPDARVYFEEIVEVADDENQIPNAGFVFFEMGT